MYRTETDKYINYQFLNGNIDMTIQISDPSYSIDKLRHFDSHRDELEEFTWRFASRFLEVEHNHQRMWVFNSNPYFKKSNPTGDKAEWSGWELHARTARMNYFITVERRKYIPPDMSTFSDFILVTQFPISDEEEKGSDKSMGLQPNTYLKEKLKVHRALIDSLVPVPAVNKIYKTIVQEKANGLLLDQETLDFYRYELDVKVAYENLGKQYVASLVSKIMATNASASKFKQLYKQMQKDPELAAM